MTDYHYCLVHGPEDHNPGEYRSAGIYSADLIHYAVRQGRHFCSLSTFPSPPSFFSLIVSDVDQEEYEDPPFAIPSGPWPVDGPNPSGGIGNLMRIPGDVIMTEYGVDLRKIGAEMLEQTKKDLLRKIPEAGEEIERRSDAAASDLGKNVYVEFGVDLSETDYDDDDGDESDE